MFFKKETEICLDKSREKGAALAIVVIILAILSVVALTALAFSSTEARIAGSDLQRTQTFYAGTAAIEKMTSDFSDLFRKKINPSQQDLDDIEVAYPQALRNEGFSFFQSIEEDVDRLSELRTIQGLPNDIYPRVNIPSGPYSGLYASIIPYKMSTIATQDWSGAEVELEREFNNYLVPLFQFGMYSNEDLEFAPGPMMYFNGRIHSNKNIYAIRNIKFLNRLTMAGELIREAKSSGVSNTSGGANNVWVEVNGFNVRSTIGSMQSGGGTVGGPYINGSAPGDRGYYPGSPLGIPNPNWENDSVLAANGNDNQFGGQVLTHTTGATQLLTPLEQTGSSAAEIIKRSLPTDTKALADSRYQNKAQIRILIDDWNAGSGATNQAGIPVGKGVVLKNNATGFNPIPLGGGNALRRVSNLGSYIDAATIKQDNGGTVDAKVVRGIKSTAATVGSDYIPPGSGIEARVLIEIVRPDGTVLDVTQEILSMGMTVGEPNGIVYLQRPLWAAYVQGSRDRNSNGFDLVSLTRNTQTVADGEITDPATIESRGFIDMTVTAADDDDISNGGSGTITRAQTPPVSGLNSIVPINLYNVREGWYRDSLNENDIYVDRGLTSVIDLNMRNLARWIDGIYDSNLLSGTNAVSSNIDGENGYIVYVSDRRGDRPKIEYLADGSNIRTTNGIVDNEDIYGPNDVLDAGEDVIDFGWDSSAAPKAGTLQKDVNELPDVGTAYQLSTYSGNVRMRADEVLKINTTYFRRSVRLFDGETLSFSAAADKLSPTKGITIAAENMVYIWGNYNTTGITGIPAGGSTLNNGGYTGPQIPSSIAADAFFPLSKTWFDGLSALYPTATNDPLNMTGTAHRVADEDLADVTGSTSVRAGIIAGTTISAMNGIPGRTGAGDRRNGGAVNYPRFLELWNYGGNTRSWNYSGSFIPLFHSTQAIAQWENSTTVTYMPPTRNWSFDRTFLTPNKLPPGTPYFQYVQATGFRQKLR